MFLKDISCIHLFLISNSDILLPQNLSWDNIYLLFSPLFDLICVRSSLIKLEVAFDNLFGFFI